MALSKIAALLLCAALTGCLGPLHVDPEGGVCGDAVLESGETCDDGNTLDDDTCTSQCQRPQCGDGLVHASTEQCDDGNDTDDDGCDRRCQLVVTQLKAGERHTCAIGGKGWVRCWGEGEDGRLGYGDTDVIGDTESPSSKGDVDLGGLPAVDLALGGAHSCALLDDLGDVRVACWGRGKEGQLGYAGAQNIGDDEPPSSAGFVDVGGRIVALAAGNAHTCALYDSGAVRCWGLGSEGQLGYGNTQSVELPASAGVVDVGGEAVALVAGHSHTCALLKGGGVHCWGRGNEGQLGNGDDQSSNHPVDTGLMQVKQLAAGGHHTCALLESGSVQCWGRWTGQPSRSGSSPVDVGGEGQPLATAKQLVAGGDHTCARIEGGGIRCWGQGDQGQLGYADTAALPAPIATNVDIGGAAVDLTTGEAHTCALLQAGRVRCWGRGDEGQLGYGNIDDVGDDEAPAALCDVPVYQSVQDVVCPPM